jgi:DNA repair protein RecO (recombination protein O)
MLSSCNGVVLSSVAYAEKGLVVKIFTDRFGLQSYFVQNAKGKKSKTRLSLFAPLSLLAIEEYHNDKGQLQKIKDVSLIEHHISIQTHPYKIAVTMFAAEFLSKILKENQADEALFEFLVHFVNELEYANNVADSPIAFVKAGIYFSGSFPQTDFNILNPYFSILEAKFVNNIHHLEVVGKKNSELLYKILTAPIETIHLGLKNRSERIEILKLLLHYCSKHLSFNGVLKSRSVLEEVLD